MACFPLPDGDAPVPTTVDEPEAVPDVGQWSSESTARDTATLLDGPGPFVYCGESDVENRPHGVGVIFSAPQNGCFGCMWDPIVNEVFSAVFDHGQMLAAMGVWDRVATFNSPPRPHGTQRTQDRDHVAPPARQPARREPDQQQLPARRGPRADIGRVAELAVQQLFRRIGFRVEDKSFLPASYGCDLRISHGGRFIDVEVKCSSNSCFALSNNQYHRMKNSPNDFMLAMCRSSGNGVYVFGFLTGHQLLTMPRELKVKEGNGAIEG